MYHFFLGSAAVVRFWNYFFINYLNEVNKQYKGILKKHINIL